jgi:hypothetical protein
MRRFGAPWALTAAAVLACATAPPGQARSATMTVKLPHAVLERNGHAGPAVHGSVRLKLPAGWSARAATHHGTIGSITLTLSPACPASIEVQTNIEVPERPMRAEIEDYLAFWFYAHKPPLPAANPKVAAETAPRRRWVLGTPPPASREVLPGEAPPTVRSPYFGVLVERLRKNIWASAALGVRTTPECADALPGRAELQAALVRTLKTASFAARIG